MLKQETVGIAHLWLKYRDRGGHGTGFELEAYIYEALKPSSFDLMMLARALTDLNRPYV
ncbi:hypothetical protein SB659_18120 [Arthrobacter sp. SIMBA_036]|uniref:hypothetical protein n=1 Tax=Arthrobacter sp. SIMBA_036 TaxID=3085778 RepID=UPI00397AC6CF